MEKVGNGHTPFYVIVQIEIYDRAAYQKYVEFVRPVVEDYGYTLLVSSRSNPEVIEGNWNPSRVIVMQFESEKQVRKMMRDDRWKTASQMRRTCARTNMVMVEGITA